jgi:hypothetical protein
MQAMHCIKHDQNLKLIKPKQSNVITDGQEQNVIVPLSKSTADTLQRFA